MESVRAGGGPAAMTQAVPSSPTPAVLPLRMGNDSRAVHGETSPLPRRPTRCPSLLSPAGQDFNATELFFSFKKKKTNHQPTKKHTFVKAEAFHRAASFRQTFAKSQAEFWWQPARFPNPVPSRQPPNPGSQDASRLPGLAAPRPWACAFPAPAGGQQLQAPPCTGPHAAGIPRLAPRLLSLL